MVVLTQRHIQLVRSVLAVMLALAALSFIPMSWHWPIVWDTQVVHYVDFLITHGRAPYREITDMNMPGAYLFEHFAIDIFGGSDFAWRIYDFFLLGVLTLGMIVIARPYDWVAGLFAGAIFTLSHGLEGPPNAAQRDELMTVLIILGYAAIFYAVRRDKPLFTGLTGLLVGLAATIKPTAAILGLGMVLLACIVLHRRSRRILPHFVLGLAGMGIAGCIAILYLLYYRSMDAFLYVVLRVIPLYSGIDHASLKFLLQKAISAPAWVLLILAVAIYWIAGRTKAAADNQNSQLRLKRWESWAIWLGILWGLASYFAQRKGYLYHRYPTMALVLLWSALQVFPALRAPGVRRWLALSAIAFGTFFVIPRYLNFIWHIPEGNYFTSYLEQDLRQIGTAPLQYQVQCLDIVYGCMNALYHDGIVQYTGATGDLLYFQTVENSAVRHYRDLFWQQLQRSPPAVFVLSNQRYGGDDTFNKVQAWPDFARFLEQNYVLTTQREFLGGRRPTSHPGEDTSNARAYRIYVRKSSPLLQKAQAR